jgi:SlyX protein
MDSGAPMFLDSAIRHTARMPDRLEAIEEKLAHLERALAELSDVVVRQQKELDRALDRNQRLMDKIAALESDYGPSATAHEKPPHY